jgi:hypothetical protein
MTPIPTIWQRQETAGWSAATKLQAFLESLTPDEQQAIELGLRRLVVLAEEATGDAGGYAMTNTQSNTLVVGTLRHVIDNAFIRRLR